MRRGRGGARGALKVGLLGGFGVGNTGNDATAAVTVQRLRSILPGVELRLITSVVDTRATAEAFDVDVVTLHRERSWRRDRQGGRTGGWTGRWTGGRLSRFVARPWNAARDLARMWVTARSVDVVVVVGGGVFEGEASAGPQGWVAMAGLFVLSVASSLGRHHLAFVGVGGTYLPSRPERRLLAASMRRADYRSFRDEGSLEAVVRMGGAGPRDHVTADLAFAVDLPAGAHTLDHTDPTRPGRVALGVMGFDWITRDAQGFSDRDPYVQALAGATAQLAAEGNEVMVFSGDSADVGVVDRVTGLAHERLADGGRTNLVTACTSVEFGDHLHALVGADVVVCSRFHNAVAALLLERATVAVADRIKVRDLMDRVGLHEYVLEARGLTAEDLVRLVRQAQERRVAIGSEIAPVVAKVRAQATSELDELAHLIEGWSSLTRLRGDHRPRPGTRRTAPISVGEDVASSS